MNNHAIVQLLKSKSKLLSDAISYKQEIDNLILEDIHELIESYVDHDDLIVEENAIILSNIFNKYNSLEFD